MPCAMKGHGLASSMAGCRGPESSLVAVWNNAEGPRRRTGAKSLLGASAMNSKSHRGSVGSAGGKRKKVGHLLMKAWSNACGITQCSSRRR